MNISIVDYPGCDPDEFVSFFGLFVQGVLGAIALCFLIIKRYRENPLIRRSWTIWLLDTSKQVAGMVFVHFINVIWASFISSEHISDACSLYLLSFLLDSSIGLVIIYLLLYGITSISINYNIWYIMPGRYAMVGPWGAPPKEMLGPWCIQCLIYLFFTAIEKMVCLLILYLPYFRRVQINWFYWLHNPKIELFLSMLVIPLVINIFIFWMTDNFLMMEDKTKSKVLIQECDSHSDDDQDLLTDHEHNENESSTRNDSSQNPIPSEPRII